MADFEVWSVPEELGGERLDRIVSMLAGVSRSAASEIIASGDVTVDGDTPARSARIPAGRVIKALVPRSTPSPVAADVPFDVRYEDADVLVVDKPAGTVTHPGAGHRDDTLLNGLLARYPELFDLGESHRWGIVHRLDRGTSGLLVVARTPTAHRRLQTAMAAREIERVYFALLKGDPGADSGTIDAPIGRDPSHPTRMGLSQDGRPARTHYVVEAKWPDRTLVEVRLETGRTHQIRVHMASIGAPVVWDETYGNTGGAGVTSRVWLHAARLSFRHPVRETWLEVESELPAELAASLAALGSPSAGAVTGRGRAPGAT